MATKTKKWILAGVALVLVVAIVLSVVLLSGSATSELQAPVDTSGEPVKGERLEAGEDYIKVAESDSYELWYYEPLLSIRLVDKNTGYVMNSTLTPEHEANDTNNDLWKGYMKSGVALTAIVGTNSNVDLNLCNVSNTITTWYTENGIYAEIYFKEKYQFGFGVEISLEDDVLTVRVPDSSIQENADGYYIGTISLFPFMGYTCVDEIEGYMLVPDGNGALIYLDDKEDRYSTGYSQMIYGSDVGMPTSTASTSMLWDTYDMVTEADSILAPIYGMAHTEKQFAYLAIVEKGDERCTIWCSPNGVQNFEYNRCYAQFLLRDVYTQPLNNSNSGTVQTVEADRPHTDLQVRFCLLSGDEANYSGMANTYREYLLDNGMVTLQDTSYSTRVDFLGVEQEDFLMGTTDVTMTTVADIEEIYEQLRSAGVSSVLSVYKGWQNGGLYNLPISSYKADNSIGSTKALTKLIQEQAEKGYDLYLYDDALLVNDETNLSTFNVMKMVSKRTYKLEVHGEVYELFYYLLPSKVISNLSQLVADTTAEGVSNLALAGITDTLFSYSSKSVYYSRSDTRYSFSTAVSSAAESCSLVLECPNAYLWKYASAILDMPMTSSGYLYLDQDIPFLSMVLKGVIPMYSEYVNFEANKTENFLNMVEYGTYPSFYVSMESSSDLIYTNSNNLYSLEFSSYAETIEEYDAALRQLAQITGSANIIGHEILTEGVAQVTYSNGVVIYVNYNETDYTDGNVTVAALSYLVGGEAA